MLLMLRVRPTKSAATMEIATPYHKRVHVKLRGVVRLVTSSSWSASIAASLEIPTLASVKMQVQSWTLRQNSVVHESRQIVPGPRLF